MTDHIDDGTRTIATGTHGRYLVRGAAGAGPHPLLVTFHGYGETAEQQLARIDGIERIDRWVRVSVQGLHRFYRGRSGEIVAGGDVPPELDYEALTAIPSVLIARGRTDTVYSEDAFAADERRLRDAGVDVRAVTTDAGHDWTGEFNGACADFLTERG